MKFLSTIFSDARGSIGGTTFSRNKSGAYTRSRVTPVNPNTPAQSAQRAAFGSLANAWRNLTLAQQDAWRDAAPDFPTVDSLGQVVTLSGQQLFMSLNKNLQAAGIATQLSSPLAPVAVASPVVSGALAVGAGTFDIAFTPDPVAADTVLIIEATRPMSAGKKFAGRSEFRSITAQAAAVISPVDIFAAYDTIFSGYDAAAGNAIFVRACIVNITTGQRSAYFQYRSVVLV